MTSFALMQIAQVSAGPSTELKTSSWTGLGLVVLLLVLLVVVIAMSLSRRSFKATTVGRGPRPRHWMIRIVCGLLGVGILAAVAIGTIREVNRRYEAPQGGAMTVHVPAKPEPVFSLPEGKKSEELSQPVRLLVQLVAIDLWGRPPEALAGKEFEVNWPGDAHKPFKRTFTLGDHRFEVTVALHSLEILRKEDGTGVTLDCWGGWEVVRRGPNGTSYDSASGLAGREWQLSQSYLHLAPAKGPMTVVSSVEAEPMFYCFITPVADDDPLKDVSLSEFVQSHRTDVIRLQLLGGDMVRWMAMRRTALDQNIPALGMQLGAYIGVSSLLLVVAAILLTQVFTHRALAFPVILAVVIMYVAILDRTALGIYTSRFEDPAASAADRRVACLQMTGTFFYGRTAMKSIDAVGDDSSAPDDLRRFANAAAEILRERWNIPKSPP